MAGSVLFGKSEGVFYCGEIEVHPHPFLEKNAVRVSFEQIRYTE